MFCNLRRNVLWAWAAFAALACQSPLPDPLSPLPGAPGVRQLVRGELEAVLQLTDMVELTALRRPPIDAIVDAEIEVMVDYVRGHGRGELVLDGELEPPSARSKHRRAGARSRLQTAATYLPSFLGLDSGPQELSRVAVARLGAELGEDAEYREVLTEGPVSATDLVVELRDAVGFLGVRALDEPMSDRILSVLDGWAHRSSPPRAIVLDLARCRGGAPTAAAAIVNAFAPGRTAFELSFREPDSDTLKRRAWGGDARSGTAVGATVPVFVVTSSHTGNVGEAIARALRYHRTARIVGSPTPGSGRVMGWYRLPWRAAFGFTVADIIGADGEPLRGHPVIPDACLGDQGMAAVRERTAEGYRVACPGAERDVSPALAIDYVQSLLRSEAAPSRPPPL